MVSCFVKAFNVISTLDDDVGYIDTSNNVTLNFSFCYYFTQNCLLVKTQRLAEMEKA